jgi:hypothetical protein
MAKKDKKNKKRVVIVEVNMRFAVEFTGTYGNRADDWQGSDPDNLAEATAEVSKCVKLDLMSGVKLVHSLTSAQPE